MKKIFFSLLLTTITLSSQLNAMWLSLARTAARNMSRRSISTFNHLMAARPLTTHSGFSGSRAFIAPQTSLLTRYAESQKSLVHNPSFRSHWDQSRHYSSFAQRLAESSEYGQSWYAYLFGVGAAATSAAFNTDDEIEDILKNYNLRSLKSALQKNPYIYKKIIMIITGPEKAETFYLFFSSFEAYKIILKLLENPQAKELFVAAIIQNPEYLKELFKTRFGRDLLNKLVDKSPQAAQQFTSAITQNPDIFKRVFESWRGQDFLNNLVENNAQAAQQFISFITQNPNTFKSLCESWYGENFLSKLLSANQKIFINLFIKNLDQWSETLKTIESLNPGFTETLLKEIKELCQTNDFGNSEKIIKMFQLCMEASFSPTSQHLRDHLSNTINSEIVTSYIHNDRLYKFFHKVHEKEKELQSKGFATFVHGQRRDYYLPEQLHTFLWELVNNTKTDDFVFAHVKEPAANQNHEQQTLVNIRRNGTKNRERILFLNYAFFGHDSYLGCNSAHYVKANANAGQVKISLADIFSFFGLNNIYDQYKDKLENMQKRYKEISPEGNLLLIGVPKDKVNDVVYLANYNGSLRSINIQDIGATNDTEIILYTLEYHPERISNTDQLEFCMIMTENGGGLDHKAVKVIPFITADNEEDLQKLEAERKALFDQIAQDIQKQRESGNQQ